MHLQAFNSHNTAKTCLELLESLITWLFWSYDTWSIYLMPITENKISNKADTDISVLSRIEKAFLTSLSTLCPCFSHSFNIKFLVLCCRRIPTEICLHDLPNKQLPLFWVISVEVKCTIQSTVYPLS